MLMEPPFEISSKTGDKIEWSDQFEKAKSGLYLPACQHFTAYGGWGNMSFQFYLAEEFSIWYSRYKNLKRAGFKAKSGSRLIEFSIQFDHTVVYRAKPFEHQTVKNSQFNVFFLPYMDSSTHFDAGQLTTTLDIHFSVDYLCSLSKYFPDILIPFLDSIENNKAALIFEKPLYATGFMLSVAGNILSHLQEQTPNPFLLELNVQTLIGYALACQYDLSTKNKRITLEQIAKIHEIKHQLETDFSQKYSLHSMAKAAHMSISSFKALFKNEIGESAYHYFLSKKMQEIRSRILNSDDPIKDISYDYGFLNVSNFSRAFKKIFKMNPTDLRKDTES